jgi:hypothetical protein
MLQVLRDIDAGRGVLCNCKGRGHAGGRANTLKGLRDRRLVEYERGWIYRLTERGKEIVVQLAPRCAAVEVPPIKLKPKHSLLRVLGGLLRKKPV